jgi:C1A family cysteine protease
MFNVVDYFKQYLSITETVEKNYKFGWKKDTRWEEQKVNYLSDKFSVFTIFNYLNSYDNIKYVDLRTNYDIPVYNQLGLNSSPSNALVYCYHYELLKNEIVPKINPSRLFLYYNQYNSLTNNENDIIGTSIFSGLNILHNLGVCSEELYPYNTISEIAPSEEAYKNASENKIIAYNAIDQNLHQLKATLINGYPILFGFNIYSSFLLESVSENGNITIPSDDEELIGQHAAVIIGYDDGDKVFLLRNSWGSEWGDSGYGYIPYEYVLNPVYASDFWIVRKSIYDSDYDKCSQSEKNSE